MTMIDDQTISNRTATWSTLAKLFAIVAAVGGVSLHLMGYVTHRTYLTSLGVDPGLFPKSADWLVINGYYTLADRFMVVFRAAASGWGKIVLAMLGVALYMFCVQQLAKIVKASSPPNWLQRTWLKELLQNLLASGLLFLVAPLTILVSMLFILLPAVLGESAGKDFAARDLARYNKGCAATLACAEVRRDGQILASGFLIDSSELHIVIYDVALNRAHAFERANTDFVGHDVGKEKRAGDSAE
jgi:hypothetical protein